MLCHMTLLHYPGFIRLNYGANFLWCEDDDQASFLLFSARLPVSVLVWRTASLKVWLPRSLKIKLAWWKKPSYSGHGKRDQKWANKASHQGASHLQLQVAACTLATTAASWFPFPPDQISVAVKDCFCKNYFNYFGWIGPVTTTNRSQKRV